MDGNYVRVRPRYTKARRRWVLAWEYMTAADYASLLAFYNANYGQAFTWVHPVSGVSYECYFSGDSLKSVIMSDTYRKVSVEIEEA